MSDGTKIEWTDATWNVVNGCTVLSPGCTNCYAMRLAGTRLKHSESRAGLTKVVNGNPVWTGEVLFNKKVALDPFKWADPRLIFVCAHGDLFHENVPDAWIDYVFMAALLNPRHTFQILTKRPERMREYMRMVLGETEAQTAGRISVAMLHAGMQNLKAETIDLHWPPRNVWLGTSVEDQKRADERIPLLLDTPAAVRWLSMEPLLGPVDLECVDLTFTERHAQEASGLVSLSALDGLHVDAEGSVDGVLGNPDPKVDWVVVGGESGPGARPMAVHWARQIRDQCLSANVPFFFKQWGDWHADALAFTDMQGRNPSPRMRVGKKAAGRELDGRFHDEYPESRRGACDRREGLGFFPPAASAEIANG